MDGDLHPGTDLGTDADLADAAVQLARRWVELTAAEPHDASERLSGLLQDPRGPGFAVGFIDGVVRPEDPQVAARNWAALLRDGVPEFLPWYLRGAVRVGARAAALAPAQVVPVATSVLRRMVAHLVLDESPGHLATGLARLHARGIRPNVNLLGEAVLGSDQAAARLHGTRALLERSDVDYVSIKVSAVIAPHSPWAFQESVQHVVNHLRPLYREALRSGTFINLDMEEYKDLDLTLAVFTTLLDEDDLMPLEAGVVLQAYLPDALGAMQRLQSWARRRRSRGGAQVKVRVVKGANLPMERVESAVRGWPLATWPTKQATDAHYKRVLAWALTPEHTGNVRIGVAGHNLFDLAWTRLLAERRGVLEALDIEMLLGMAPATAAVLRRETGRMLLYTPVVRAHEFDVAIAYLVRRLEEGAAPENFMSSMFDLDRPSSFALEEGRFRASLADLAADGTDVPTTNRTQDRRTEHPQPPEHFANTPDTDPSLAANRAWGRAVLDRVRESQLGTAEVAQWSVTDAGRLDTLLEATRQAGLVWGRRPAAERSAVLRRAAAGLAAARGQLLEVMASECGKTLEEGDPEVSEAIDFAAWYADRAEDLDRVSGARWQARALTVVTPPWNFPVAIPAGSTLAALAAGSAVVLKPAPQARRCGSVLATVLWEAGVPRDVLRLVHADESDLASTLVADPRVDQVILTGGYETAELFASMRPGLRLYAETSGKNALLVTPSADLDLAARDLVHSAFGHAGQKCSAASLGILVGSVGTSRRFLGQLVDATRSLVAAVPEDATAQMGPLVEPPGDKLLRGLTVLGPGESWLVEPRRLDASGRLWSPGIRAGVRPGSEFHRTEYFGPVLGLMHAPDLDTALDWQNAVDHGLTAGLHSLDVDEQTRWLARVEAGNLYVNRGTTGAIVRRQPFGGWKKSAVGPGAKAGGPHYLKALVDWSPAPADPRPTGTPTDFQRDALGLCPDPADREVLDRAFADDRAVWTGWRSPHDVSGLVVETNALRHLPRPTTVRSGAGAAPVDVLRVVAAGHLVGARVEVSLDPATPSLAPLGDLLSRHGIDHRTEDGSTWLARLEKGLGQRVRFVGTDQDASASRVRAGVRTAVVDHAVTEAGELELLPFLAEQAVSITHHRFGTTLDSSPLVGLVVDR